MVKTPGRTAALSALVLAAACVVLLRKAPPDVPFHPDIVRSILISRNFLLDRSASLGSPSSTIFYHGFTWDYLMMGIHRLGIPLARLPLLIGMLHAAGLLLFFHVAARATDPWTASLAAMVFALVSSSRLFDGICSLTLIPAAMSLLLFVLHRACSDDTRHPRAWFALCAVLFSLATQLHLEIFLFLPGLAFVLASLERRAWAAPAFLALTFGPWMLVSSASAAANWRLLQEVSWRSYPGGASSGLLLARLTPLLIASLFLALFARRRSPRLPVFQRLIVGGAASYGIALSGIFLFHFFDRQYLMPLFPLMILMAAMFGRSLFQRLQTPVLLRWSIPLLLLGYASAVVGGTAPAQARAQLSLGEIHSIVSELRLQGYGPGEMYRLISSGQALQTDFQSGMWIDMPCLSDVRVIGAGDRPDRRVLATAVPRGFPTPAGSERVAGDSRDILLTGYTPWVDPARFFVGDALSRPRTLSFDNPGYRQPRCLDVNLPYAARSSVRRQESPALTFPVRIPASGESRVFYLPGVAAQGQRRPGCAAKITKLAGVKAHLAPGAHQLELRPTGRPQRGTITIEWPTEDPGCFAEGFVFYPMPMAEMPDSLFSQLGPFLD